jgi:hypothetical protein
VPAKNRHEPERELGGTAAGSATTRNVCPECRSMVCLDNPNPESVVMSKADHLIYAVHVTDRLHQVSEVQRLLTEYGCQIKTRLGLHESSAAPNGLLLLEMIGDVKRCQELFDKLNAITGIEVKSVTFDHA